MVLFALFILLHIVLNYGISGFDLYSDYTLQFFISIVVRDASYPKIKDQKDEEPSASLKTPIYLHTPVKVYNNAKESKSDMARDFINKTII